MKKGVKRNLRSIIGAEWLKLCICLSLVLMFSGLFSARAYAAQKSYILLYTGSEKDDSAELEQLLSGGKGKDITDYETWNVLSSVKKNGILMADIVEFLYATGSIEKPTFLDVLEVYPMDEKNTSFALLNSYTGEYMVFKNKSKKVSIYQFDGKKKKSYTIEEAAEIKLDESGRPETIYIPVSSLQYLYGYRCIGQTSLKKEGYTVSGISIDGEVGNYCLLCLDPLKTGKLPGSKAAKIVDSIVREYDSPKMYYPVKAQKTEEQSYVMVYTGGDWEASAWNEMAKQLGYSNQIKGYVEDGCQIYLDNKEITKDVAQQKIDNSHIFFFPTKKVKDVVMVDFSNGGKEWLYDFSDFNFFPNTDWEALLQEDFGIAHIGKTGEEMLILNSFSEEYGVFRNGSKKMTVYSFQGKKKATYTLSRAVTLSMEEEENWWLKEAWIPQEALQYLFGYCYVDTEELEKQDYVPKCIDIRKVVKKAGDKAYVEEYRDCTVSFLVLDPTKSGIADGKNVADAVASAKREFVDSYYYLLAKEANEAIQNASLNVFLAKMNELRDSRHLYSLDKETNTYIMESCIRAAVERLKKEAMEMPYGEFTGTFLKMAREGGWNWLREDEYRDEVAAATVERLKKEAMEMPYGEFTETFLKMEQEGGWNWLREGYRDEIVATAVKRVLKDDTSRYGMWKLTYAEFIDIYRSIGTENDLFLKTLKEKGTAHTEVLKYYEYDLVPGIEFAFDDILSEKIYCLEYAPFNYSGEDLKSGNTGKGTFEAFYDHGGVCGILTPTYEYFIRNILGEKNWQYAQYGNAEVNHAVVIIKTEDGRCFQVDNGESDYWWLGSLLTPDVEKIGSVPEDAGWREAFERWKVEFKQLTSVQWYNFRVFAHWSHEKKEWVVRPVWYDYEKNEWQMYLGAEMPRYMKFTYTGLPGKVISMAGHTRLSGYIDLDELEFH